MSELKIELADDRTAFEPGAEIRGRAFWKLDAAVHAIELRLFWFTRGKGTEDAVVVDSVRFDQPREDDSGTFRFKLPEAPYSFSGKLISLIWSLELVTQPRGEVARTEIVVAPGAQEVRLESIPNEPIRISFSGFGRSRSNQ
jgi:hypothetical protein